MISGQL